MRYTAPMRGFSLSASKGFTLIELLVVIFIMSALSIFIVVAYPNVRAEQKLTLAEQTLQAALRAAQQGAINEERPDECVEVVSVELAKRCSDTGVVLNPAASSMIIFADISDDPRTNTFDEGEDFVVSEVTFPEGVVVEPSEPQTVLIFEGKPPTIQLYSGTQEVTSFIPITLRAGNATRQLQVGSYGQVER